MARVTSGAGGGGARERAARSLLWTALESGGLSALSVIALVVFGWTLTPAELGIGALALSVVQLMNLPVEMLFHDALIQRREIGRRHVDTAFTVSLLLGILLSAACWWAGDLLAAEMGDPRVAPVLGWMSLSLPAMGFAGALVARHQRGFHFRILALRSLVGRVGAFAAAVALAVLGAGVWALVAYQVLSVALGAAVLWLASTERPRLGFGWPEFRELAGFGVRVLGARAAEFAALPLFTVYVSVTFGAETTGYFSLAQRTVETLRAVITDAFARLTLPLFARLQDSPRLLRRTFQSSTELLCAATFPLFAGFGALAPEVIGAVFGQRWAPAAPIATALCLLALLTQARLYSLQILMVTDRPQEAIAIRATELLALAAGCLLGPALLPAAVGAWMARLLAATPLDIWLVRRAIGLSVAGQLRPLVVPALVTAAMVACVLALGALMGDAAPMAVRLPIQVAAGAAIYALSLHLVRHPLLWHLRAAVRSAFPGAAAKAAAAAPPGERAGGSDGSRPPPRPPLAQAR
jgi:O-antigen/teichoic acid export membrane protein